MSALRSRLNFIFPTLRRCLVAEHPNSLSFSVFRRSFASSETQSSENRNEVEARILELLRGFDKVHQNKLTTTAHFMKDLGLDSLDTVEVVMAIEEEFSIEIPDDKADSIVTVDQAIDYVCSREDAY